MLFREGVPSMKKIVGFVLVLGLVLGAFAGWISFEVESAHQQWVARLEARPDLRVLSSRFDRGWLRSEAETRFELRGPAGAVFQAPLRWAGREDVRQRVGFLVDQTIEHGPLSLFRWLEGGAQGSPIVAYVDASVVLDQEAHSELSAAFGRLPSMRARVAVRASGEAGGPVTMQAAPLRPRDVAPGATPRWVGRFEGLRGDVQVRDGQVVLQLDFGGLQLAGPELDFEAERWSARWETSLAPGPARAHSEHALADLSLELRPDGDAGEKLRLQISGAAWKSESDREALRWVGTAASSLWNDLALTGVRLDASWPRDPAVGEEPSSAAAELGFLPEWHIEQLEGRLADGPFLLAGELRLVAPASVPGMTTPPESAVHGDLELRFPRSLAETLLVDHPERLEAWLAEGQIARDRDALRTRLMWNDRGWLANGLPLETEGWLDKLVPERVMAPAALAASEAPDPDETGDATDAAAAGSDDAPGKAEPAPGAAPTAGRKTPAAAETAEPRVPPTGADATSSTPPASPQR